MSGGPAPGEPGSSGDDAEAKAAAGERVDAALHRGGRYLERRGVEEPLRNARFLLAHAVGVAPGALAARLSEPLPPAVARAFGKLLCARGRRQPLQYLLGSWEFFGLELEVGPAALIPRPETEVLVERVLELLPPGRRRIVDVGTGTGAIAIALARARPDLSLLASDRSAAALELAGRNLARHGLGERVELLAGDLLAPLAGRAAPGSIDAVVANPPYVAEAELQGLEPEVRDHEPRFALVAGPTGLELYQRLIPQAAEWLRPGGLLALEVGAGQAARVIELAGAAGFTDARAWPDLAGCARVVTARR